MTLPFIIADLLKDAPLNSGGWSGGGSSSVLIVLFLLLIGSSFAVWIFFKRGTFTRMKGGEQLQILETRALGGRQFLLVARHSNQKFLLGVCPGRIDYLCPLESGSDFDSDETFETVLQEKNSPNKPS
ncbi:MAG: flagellar biosynthetic protein FliO [Verrucomicrobia bacterium]|nr:flagellar biosynthetic protein FliO [Verrucomicrobiota bacterium]